MKILFLVNAKPSNTYRRAYIFFNYLKCISNNEATFLYREGNIWNDFFYFLKQILFGKYDIVYIFEAFLPTFPFLFLILRFKLAKLVYDSGDIHFLNAELSGYNYLGKVFTKLNEFLAYNFSHKIIVRGGSAIQVISNLYRIPIDKILWIPDGVDLSKFESKNSKELRANLGLLGKFVLGYASSIRTLKVGKMHTARGWELLEIGKMMIKSGRFNFKILIIGDGPGLNLLIKRSIDYGLKEYVIFTGFVSEKDYPKYLNCMDVGFYESINHPSYLVMMPTKLVEYMASSLPIVAGNIGEPKRTFADNGILYKPLEPDSSNLNSYLEEIFEGFCRLYDDPPLALKMGRNSRQIALQYYDWKTIRQSFLDALKKISGDSVITITE